jgi:hypothetical protein
VGRGGAVAPHAADPAGSLTVRGVSAKHWQNTGLVRVMR